jgi:hypothetical protein
MGSFKLAFKLAWMVWLALYDAELVSGLWL